MNRPVYALLDECNYRSELEKYCDELEKSHHDMFIELCKYKRATNVLSHQIGQRVTCDECIFYDNNECLAEKDNKSCDEAWKEWCLKDE